MAGLRSGGYPYLAEMGTDLILQPGYDHADQFEHCLDLLLDGLERARALAT